MAKGGAGPGAPVSAAMRAQVDARAAAAAGGRLAALSWELRLRPHSRASRARGHALLWLARPDRLRLHLLGPHGPPVAMVALGEGRMVYLDLAAATATVAADAPAALDALLPLPPLGLDGRGWVALLLGEVRWPKEAEATQAGAQVRLAWRVGDRLWVAWVSPATGLWERLEVGGEGAQRWAVEARGRDAQGVPEALVWWSPPLDAGGEVVQTEVRLRDVEVDPPLAPNTFVLEVPPAFGVRPVGPHPAP